MRICLLTNQDLDAPDIAEDDWPCDPRPFYPEAEWDVLVLEKETAVRQITTAARRGYDLFFNLCDGAWDEETPGIEVIITLERLELPFTGATSEFYEPTREAMKRVCRAWGIDTPAYAFVHDADEIARAAETLSFPLFVKHPSSYASIGLTRRSRVDSPADLVEQASLMISEYGGALIEEFVDGTEYTVLVAENPRDPDEPIAYQPVEYRFPDGEAFKHADLKWVDYEAMETSAVEDPELDARLSAVSTRFFRGLNGAGYGRCDIRVDAAGRPFMLEINPNCGLYNTPEDAGSADFCLLRDERGHRGFTETIIEAAFRRHARRIRNWEVVPWKGGYTLRARQEIEAGATILRFEGQPHNLVTLDHMEQRLGEVDREWFRRHAWPLTDELWATWSRDPHHWIPIQHSCEPAAWFEGLDVVARRRLAPGDEITLDYATFHNERMPSFVCDCGDSACRGTIRGEDSRKDFVERYGEHLSAYVRQKRRDRKNAR